MHDELWCKAALAFFRMRHLDHLDRDVPPIYSLGPKLCRSIAEYTSVLASIVNPVPLSCGGSSKFDFRDDGDDDGDNVQDDECDFDDGLHIHKGANRVMFFSIQKPTLNRVVVVKGAPKVVDSTAMAINCHIVRELHMEGSFCRLNLEGECGEALSSTVLSCALLNIDDFKTFRLWDTKDALYYDFGFPVPSDHRSTFQDVVNKITKTNSHRDAGKRPYIYFDSEDPDFKIHTCLQMLESRELLERRSEDPSTSAWTLTSLGETSLRITLQLGRFQPALQVRPDIAIVDAMPFELARMMHDAGWVCLVKPPRARRKKPAKSATVAALGISESPQPMDFKPGQPKQWWLLASQVNFRAWYMRALLQAGKGILKAVIPHFKTERYYECLISGEPYVPRQRKKKFKMDGEPSEPPRKRRRRKPIKEVAVAEKSSVEEVAEESSQNSGTDGDLLATESSSDSSSSSSSKGSSSSSSAAAAAPPKPAGVEAPKPAAVPRCAASAAAAPSGVSRTMLDTTVYWKSFKFTEVKGKDGQVNGYEVTCKITEHKDKTRCTRSMRFGKHGGRDVTVHKLKWWCVAGYHANVGSKAEHQGLPFAPAAGLPTWSEIEAVPIPKGQIGYT